MEMRRAGKDCYKDITLCKHTLSLNHTHTPTHPIFVIRHVTQHIVQVQDASISMFQPVHLDPVAGVLKKERVLAL